MSVFDAHEKLTSISKLTIKIGQCGREFLHLSQTKYSPAKTGEYPSDITQVSKNI